MSSSMEGVKRFADHDDDDASITISTLIMADRHTDDANEIAQKMFRTQITSMNRRLNLFNHEKKILKNLDLFVLDNSLQERHGHKQEYSLEEMWKIYEEVKKVGFQNIVIACFDRMTSDDERFLQDLQKKKEINKHHFAVVEFVDLCRESLVPKDNLPSGYEKCKHYGIQNIVIEIDLAYDGIDYSKFNLQRMCLFLSERFKWIRQNMIDSSRIILHIRDFSTCMQKHPIRMFSIVNYISSLPESDRIFGFSYEDDGRCFPEQLAVWTYCIREEMNRFGWYKGQLLAKFHDQYGLCEGTTLDCLADGASGIWAGLSEEGSGIGHGSSFLTITNLVRLGNTRVQRKYSCSDLLQASRVITKVITGHPPHPRQRIIGHRALDLSALHITSAAESKDEILISGESSCLDVLNKLHLSFGVDRNFNEERASRMKEIMRYDEIEKKIEDYNSNVGLAILYQRSGGRLNIQCLKDLINIIEKRKNNESDMNNIMMEIRLMWNNCKNESSDHLDYSAFYTGFLSPYIALCRDNETSKLLDAIALQKDGKISWNDFLVHLKWASNQCPEKVTSDEILRITFSNRIFPLMKQKAMKDMEAKHKLIVDNDKYYTDSVINDDEFFTTGTRMENVSKKNEVVIEPNVEIEEDIIMEQEATVEESGIDEESFLEGLEETDEGEDSRTTTYVITVKTGECYGAGTDANVHIQMFGDKGDTEVLMLDSPMFSDQSFERGYEDKFTLEAANVGRLKKVRIGHDNAGGFAGWYLDWVHIKADNYEMKFKADRWLDQYTGDKKLDIEIFPIIQEEEITPQVELGVDASEENEYRDPVNINVRTAQLRTYDIHVKTGNVMFAGTDATVYLTLYGNEGVSHKMILDKSKTFAKPFERKQVDKFTVEALYVGDITKVRIGHDGTGVGAGWYIDGLSVQIPDTKLKWNFEANRWLDEKTGDGQLEIDLYPTKKN